MKDLSVRLRNATQAHFVAFLAVSFLCVTGLSILRWPKSIDRLIATDGQIDASFYVQIAQGGYTNDILPAFYPLWPALLRVVALPFDARWTHLTGELLALVLFLASLKMFELVLKQHMVSSRWAQWAMLLFCFNPNSIFHTLAYAESLFSLLCLLFFYFFFRSCKTEPQRGSLVWTFVFATLMATARPIYLQGSLASVSALVLMFLLQKKMGKNVSELRPVALSMVSGLLGFALGTFLVCLVCKWSTGNFWAAFDAQSHWNRKFGFHWELFASPKSVSSSDNVLNWDLQAFYLPTILGAFAVYDCLRRFRLQTVTKVSHYSETTTGFLFWFSLLFCAAHAAIAFFSYPIFMSTARHVFAVPPFFFAVSLMLERFGNQGKVKTFVWAYFAMSFAFYVYWWSRFARDGWIG